MKAGAASVALAVAMLAGCQASGDVPERSTSPVSSPPTLPISPSGTPPSPAGPTPSPQYLMPLALVVHATRPAADVAVADARRVVASGAGRWSAIGQFGGRMRVISTDERSTSDVLRAVRSSRDVLGIVPADAVDARVRVLTVGGHHPLRDPERYPLHIRSERPLPEVTTLAAVGDIMLGRRVGARHRVGPAGRLKPLAKGWGGAG